MVDTSTNISSNISRWWYDPHVWHHPCFYFHTTFCVDRCQTHGIEFNSILCDAFHEVLMSVPLTVQCSSFSLWWWWIWSWRSPLHTCTHTPMMHSQYAAQSVMSAWPPRQLVADSEAWLLFRAGETCRRFLFKGEWVDRSRPSESFGDAKLHHSPCAYAIRYQKATRGH